MKYLGAMSFKDQARIFVGLITFQTPSSVFASRNLLKKELPPMLIHVCKIFNCKVSFKCRCRCASWLLRKNFEHSCDQELSEWQKITITVTEVVFMQLFSLTIGSKQKIKMKTRNAMEPSYHSKVRPSQNKAVSFFPCLAHGVYDYISLFG